MDDFRIIAGQGNGLSFGLKCSINCQGGLKKMANIFKLFDNGLVLGTDEDDFIVVLAGNTTIVGLGGNDKIISGLGSTKLYGDIKEDIILNFVSTSTILPTIYGAMAPDITIEHNKVPIFGNDKIFGFLKDDKAIWRCSKL